MTTYMTLAWDVSRTEGGGGIRLDWEERQGWYYALTDLHPCDVLLHTAITVLRKDRLCLTGPSVGRLDLKAAPTPWPPPSRRAGDLATSMHCGAVAQVPVGARSLWMHFNGLLSRSSGLSPSCRAWRPSFVDGCCRGCGAALRPHGCTAVVR